MSAVFCRLPLTRLFCCGGGGGGFVFWLDQPPLVQLTQIKRAGVKEKKDTKWGEVFRFRFVSRGESFRLIPTLMLQCVSVSSDIDECAEGLIECHNHSRCVNLPGWYHCECRSGFHDNASYLLDGSSCIGEHTLTLKHPYRWLQYQLLDLCGLIPPLIINFVPLCL